MLSCTEFDPISVSMIVLTYGGFRFDPSHCVFVLPELNASVCSNFIAQVRLGWINEHEDILG